MNDDSVSPVRERVSGTDDKTRSKAPLYSEASLSAEMHARFSVNEIERAKRFGIKKLFRAGDLLFEAGHPCAGMLLILEGTVRVNHRDGLGRTLDEMVLRSGQFVAEVGQLSGKPALVDACAIDNVEALLLAPLQLRQLIVGDAELGERIMRSLILRRARLVEEGSGPVIIGHASDPHVAALEGFLARNDHPHRVADAQMDPQAMDLLTKTGILHAELPVVLCPDGTILRRPSEATVASHLNWFTAIEPDYTYDVAVIGAGPAGLAAAVYAASEGLSVLVVDGCAPGGQAGESSRIENYLGFATGVSGRDLARGSFLQAQKFGAHIAIPIKVKSIRCSESPIELELSDGRRVRSRTLVIATGASYRRAGSTGLDELNGRGTYYWASPAGARHCSGLEVAVIGGGNSAGQGAAYLATYASHVHVLFRGNSLEASMSRYLIGRLTSAPNITLHHATEIQSVKVDDGRLSGLLCSTPAGMTELDVRHAFVFTGAKPNTAWLQDCGVRMDGKGFILTGTAAARYAQKIIGSLETSIPGVFAIGDVRSGSTKRVAAAVGEGAGVVVQIHAAINALKARCEESEREAVVAIA